MAIKDEKKKTAEKEPTKRVEVPLAEEKPKAEVLPVEEKPKMEAKVPEAPPVEQIPSLAEIMESEDCSQSTAVKLREAFAALERERAFRAFARQRKDQAHFVCKAQRPSYWRIGREFGMAETVVFIDELTPEQLDELTKTDPVHMSVKKVMEHQVKESWKPKTGE